MLRKLALAVSLAAGTVGLTTTAAAAQPPIDLGRHAHDEDRDHGRFQVLVRHRWHWDVHGTYRDRDDAYRVARQLERRGYDAKVERVRGR